jgi:hypothetical protein
MVPSEKALNITELRVKVKLFICLTKYHAMKTYGGAEIYFHNAFLNSERGERIPVGEKSSWYPLDRRLGRPQNRSRSGD